MVWFQCEDCGDTLKKPKIRGHASQCSASRFSCVDCLQVFDFYTVQQHTSCVTEHEKYALSITKPGQEHLMSATANKEQGGGGPAGGGGAVVGEDFLSKSPPYECTCCKVKCTSWETLLGHAQGKKHKSKSRSAYAAQGKGPDGKPLPKEEEKKEEELEAAAKRAEEDADAGAGGGEENAADESPVKEKKEKKEKKRKRDKEDKSPKKEKKAKKEKKEKKAKKEKK